MFDDNELKARIEKRLENFKQWKDEFGIYWVEMNNQKFPKNQLINICLENERLEMLKEKSDFLSF